MANRYLLAYSRLEEFATWAETQGYKREPTKGDYEILRLRRETMTPRLYFRRDVGGQVHVTCQDKAVGLVRRWIRERDDT